MFGNYKLFGRSTGFNNARTGTRIKFNPPIGIDLTLENADHCTVSTRHQCITAMKEYENMSFEELRHEYYKAGRITDDNFGMQLCVFGSIPEPPDSGFSFGNSFFVTANIPLFGSGAKRSNIASGGQGNGPLFGAAATSAFGTPPPTFHGFSTGFRHSNTSAGNTLFGSSGLNTASGGQGNGPLFGAAATSAFGTPPPTFHGFSTGFRRSNTSAGNTLFGSSGLKTASGGQGNGPLFGAAATSAFGTPPPTFHGFSTGFRRSNTSAGNTLFGSSGLNTAIGGQGNGPLFGAAATSAFGTPPPTFRGFSTGFRENNTSAGNALFGSSPSGSEERDTPEVKLPKCLICLLNDRNVVFQPCGHFATCFSCSYHYLLYDCPVCRRRIEKKLKIYVS